MLKWIEQKILDVPKFISEGDIEKYLEWFINLRWIAIGGLFFTITISYYLFNAIHKESLIPLYILTGVVLVSNLEFIILLKLKIPTLIHALLQTTEDLILLTLILHYSGGIENPFFTFYLFHIVIGGIIFSKRNAFRITLLTGFLFSQLAIGEYLKIIPHFHLALSPAETYELAHKSIYILAVVIGFLTTLFLTNYFVSNLVNTIRRCNIICLWKSQK